MKRNNSLVFLFILMVNLVNCNISKAPELDNTIATNESNMDSDSSPHIQVNKKAKIDFLIKSIIDFTSNIIGDVLNLLKTFISITIDPSTKKSELADHFVKTKEKLEIINQKLDESESKINEKVENSNYNIRNKINSDINHTKGLIDKFNDALNKFLLTKDIKDKLVTGFKNEADAVSGVINSNIEDVNAIIEGFRTIINLAKDSGMTDISQVTLREIGKSTKEESYQEDNGISLLLAVGMNTCAANDKNCEILKEIENKIDGWAILYVIGNNEINSAKFVGNKSYYGARDLAIKESVDIANINAKTEEDLVAAFVLRAMSKTGRFSFDESKKLSSEEVVSIIKETVSSAVSKVISVINTIIKTVIEKEINKINESVKNI